MLAFFLPITGCQNIKIHSVTSRATGKDRSMLLTAHNEERKKLGLQPLKINNKLQMSAQKHADWMAKSGKLSHTGDGKSDPGSRIDHEGYNSSGWGENIAMGYTEISKVMAGWMHSSGHRDNILGDYTEVGFGVAYNEDGTSYWTVNFGKP